jgi:hypothetical protein
MDPEFKKMIGRRMKDADGFTYVYGAVKDGSSVRPATAATKKAVRADKRKVKNAVSKRIRTED